MIVVLREYLKDRGGGQLIGCFSRDFSLRIETENRREDSSIQKKIGISTF